MSSQPAGSGEDDLALSTASEPEDQTPEPAANGTASQDADAPSGIEAEPSAEMIDDAPAASAPEVESPVGDHDATPVADQADQTALMDGLGDDLAPTVLADSSAAAGPDWLTSVPPSQPDSWAAPNGPTDNWALPADQTNDVAPAAAPLLAAAQPKAAKPAKTKSARTKPPTKPGDSTRPPKKKHRGLVAIVTTLAVLLVLGSAVGAAIYYFQDHVKPAVTLMGQAVTGKTQTEIETMTADMVKNYQVSLTMNGQTVQATAADLGVTFDQPATVAAVMNPPADGGVLQLYNPWHPKPVVLSLTVDQTTLQDYLNKEFIPSDQRSTPAGLMYDEGQITFNLVPSATGTQADAATVATALAAGQGVTEPLVVPTVTELPTIADAAAQAVVDSANLRLTNPLVAHTADASFTVPAASIANWLIITPNEAAGTITMTFDTDRLATEVPDMLNSNLASPPIAQQILTGPDGQTLGVETSGKNGTVVSDTGPAVAAFSQALQDGTSVDVAVDTVAQPYSTESISMGSMDPGYLEPNGTHWVEVNNSTATVTAWAGTTAIMSSPAVVGAKATPTRNGVFHIYARYTSQTMEGYNADGVTRYKQPDVPWVSYFSGGEALHGAYWRSVFGYAGSHGCVNMPVPFAKDLYDFTDIGTLVVVHT